MEINIENYIPYLMNPRFDIKYENKNLNHSNEKKLVSNIDTLFFNFLNIIKHKSINEFYDKNVEKNKKIVQEIITIFFCDLVKKRIAGIVKKVTLNRLNANKPIGFKICKISVNQDQLYPHKFQGNPEKILDLI